MYSNAYTMTTEAISDICYICYESDTSISPFMNPSPCQCKGSNKIHNHCLYSLFNQPNKKCCICKSNYRFPDGHFKWYHANGSVAIEGTYSNNLYQGTITYYYPDGTLRAVELRKDGEYDGLSKFYHENGTIRSEQLYENGKRTGAWRFYYSDGKLNAEENFKNGKLNGNLKMYWENGKLRNEMNYKNGVVDGTVRFYHSNGVLHVKEHYRNGKKEGMFKAYNEHGLLACETLYINDIAKYRRLHFQPI